MKKLVFAGLATLLSGAAMSDVNCFALKESETLEVKVIDTFFEKTAFINRIHPTERYPLIDIGVQTFEKTGSLSFVNEKQNFILTVEKKQMLMSDIYKASLQYNDVVTGMECLID